MDKLKRVFRNVRKSQPNTVEDKTVGFIDNAYGFVHNITSSTTVWIGYSIKRRKFVQRLEKFIQMELQGRAEFLYQDCIQRFGKPEMNFLEESLRVATKYVLLFDSDWKTDVAFKLKFESACQSHLNKSRKNDIIFVKMDQSVQYPNAHVVFKDIDFSLIDRDNNFSNTAEIRSLIHALLDLDIDLTDIQIAESIFIGGDCKSTNRSDKGNTYCKEDYIYTFPHLLDVKNCQKIRNIAPGVSLTFFPSNSEDSSVIIENSAQLFKTQVCTITEQALKLVSGDERNECFRKLFNGFTIGTYFSVLPYSIHQRVTGSETLVNARVTVIDSKLKHFPHKQIRVLYSDSFSPVGRNWNDVTSGSDLTAKEAKPLDESEKMTQIRADSVFQFNVHKCGVYMLGSSDTPDNTKVHESVAEAISCYVNTKFARLILHCKIPEYKESSKNTLKIRGRIVRLDSPMEHYGREYLDVIVRLEGQYCYAIVKFICPKTDTFHKFPHTFDLARIEQSSFYFETSYNIDWSFTMKFYSDENHNYFLAKMSNGGCAAKRKTWPPLHIIYSRRWSVPLDYDVVALDKEDNVIETGGACGSHLRKSMSVYGDVYSSEISIQPTRGVKTSKDVEKVNIDKLLFSMMKQSGTTLLQNTLPTDCDPLNRSLNASGKKTWDALMSMSHQDII